MWAHPTVGQLLGIGLSLACCIYTKATGTGNKYLMKGKIHHNLPIDLREDMAFWLNAGGHFQMYQEICITVAVFKANGGDYSVA
jgi:hypothetical protein